MIISTFIVLVLLQKLLLSKLVSSILLLDPFINLKLFGTKQYILTSINSPSTEQFFYHTLKRVREAWPQRNNNAHLFVQPFYYAAIFFNIKFRPMHLLPGKNIMLDIIFMGSIELRGTRGGQINTKWQILAQTRTRTHSRIHSQMLNRALLTDYFSKLGININAYILARSNKIVRIGFCLCTVLHYT